MVIQDARCAAGKLLLAALKTGAMRQLRPAAILAHEKLFLLERQMRPPAPYLAMAMMFYWYATHADSVPRSRRTRWGGQIPKSKYQTRNVWYLALGI
jgi:hypothetical protein